MSARATTESVMERVMGQVEYVETCWIFTGHVDRQGYGRVGFGAGKHVLVHRLTYEALIGPIPDGLVLDHVVKRGCLSTSCCNPDHLEPVTVGENVRRGRLGYANRTTCKSGHDITDPANVYVKPDGGNDCRRCRAEATRRYRERKAAR